MDVCKEFMQCICLGAQRKAWRATGQDTRVSLVWFQCVLCCACLDTVGKTVLPPARGHGDLVSVGIARIVLVSPTS